MTLLWLDLETTGLDPFEDKILEIGIILTDHELKWITQASWVVGYLHPDERDFIRKRADVNDPHNPNPFVADMHTKNNLWHEVLGSLEDAKMVNKYIQNWLEENAPRTYDMSDKILPLHPAGSSVHFDVEFLKFYMPEVVKYFHHRHYDVSSIKMYYETLEGTYDSGPEDKHRVLDDLRNDLNWVQNRIFDYQKKTGTDY